MPSEETPRYVEIVHEVKDICRGYSLDDTYLLASAFGSFDKLLGEARWGWKVSLASVVLMK
jgi:hypothetical protein